MLFLFFFPKRAQWQAAASLVSASFHTSLKSVTIKQLVCETFNMKNTQMATFVSVQF